MSSRLKRHRGTLSQEDSYSDGEEINDRKLYGQLKKVKYEIERTEPNINQILTEPMLLEDRAELLQLYELYKMMEMSEERINLRKKIINKFTDSVSRFKQYNKYSSQEHQKFNQELKDLERYSMWEEVKYKILSLNTTMENKRVIYSHYKRLSEINTTDDEYHKLKDWLKWAVSLPYDKVKAFPFDRNGLTAFLKHVAVRLDQELYGMKMVKEQILIFLSAKILNPMMRKCSLGLVGLPGTGKTFISRLLADILDFPFEQISFGGVSNPEFIKGHQYTYIGAQPGEFVKCLKRMGYKNGILFLDEYDKVAESPELCSALLHLTDFSQNSDFRDNYLSGISIDLSHLWFIYSMNKLPANLALRDRIFAIEVPGYSQDDKIHILCDYLLPRALKNVGMKKGDIVIPKKVAQDFVNRVSDTEPGVRSLEKHINSVVNKISFIKNHQSASGELNGFDVSFNIHSKVKLPFKLSSSHLDIFLQFPASPQFGPIDMTL